MDLNNTTNSNEGDDSQDLPLWLFILISIIHTFFIIAYIIPNVFLIVTFIKRHFYKQHLFYIIVHWSFANLLHMIFAIYVQYVSNEFTGQKWTTAFLAVHCSISGIPLNISMCMIFDKFMTSKNFCFKSIRNNWILLILQIAILLSLVFTDIFEGWNIALGYVIGAAIAVIVFISRLIRFWCKGSEEENYHLRAWMAGIFILSSCIFAIWLIIEVILEIHVTSLSSIALSIILINGYVNSILLFIYDERFNTIVKDLKPKCCKRFGKKETVVAELEVVEAPSNYENKRELSPYYDEVSVSYEGIDQIRNNIGDKRSNGDRNVSIA